MQPLSKVALYAGALMSLAVITAACDSQEDHPQVTFLISVGNQLQMLSNSGERLGSFGFRGYMPNWTSGGNSFVFVRDNGLMAHKLGAPFPRSIVSDHVFAERPFALVDGSILFQDCPTCEVSVRFSIAFYDAARDEVRYLTSTESSDRSPVADDTRGLVYYLSDRDNLGGSQVYRMSLSGSEPVRISSRRQSTGGALAISRGLLAYDDHDMVRILDLATEELVDSLSFPAGHSSRGSLSFSPTGDSLCVVTISTSDAASHVIVYDLATKSAHELMTSPNQVSVSWRPR